MAQKATPSVHPRSRGEHDHAELRADGTAGSSPLARGTLVLQPQHEGVRRFIPARAGNTRARCAPRPVVAVHPRSRGEHMLDWLRRHAATGSSPLARGTLGLPLPADARERFIPARAGNTLCGRIWVRMSPVHPRSRGEHARIGGLPTRKIGSSPLARGTRQHPSWRREGGRFIPARAGNTRDSRS